jgi:splicing factor U2AF subunit
MADYLASIFGTEKDKVNCSFYFKIGACRHGDRCNRQHNRPTFSQTVLIYNWFQNPAHIPGCMMTPEELLLHFDNFYEDIFIELAQFGEIEDLIVCDNMGDHLVGNVYVRYTYEDMAGRCVQNLNDRFYAGRPLFAELSPVTDFRESCCRQNELNECTRGGYCNFMHLIYPSRFLKRRLMIAQSLHDANESPSSHDRNRSRSKEHSSHHHRHHHHRHSSSSHHSPERERSPRRHRSPERERSPRRRRSLEREHSPR